MFENLLDHSCLVDWNTSLCASTGSSAAFFRNLSWVEVIFCAFGMPFFLGSDWRLPDVGHCCCKPPPNLSLLEVVSACYWRSLALTNLRLCYRIFT